MRLNTLKPARGAKRLPKRVGRGIGSGTGKTAGRGHKGQSSRSGGGVRPGFEGGQQPLQLRVPKFGFNSAKARSTAQVTLSEVSAMQADVVDLAALMEASVIKRSIKRARVILSGKIARPVTLKGLHATKGARAAIEAAGGKVEAAPPQRKGSLQKAAAGASQKAAAGAAKAKPAPKAGAKAAPKAAQAKPKAGSKAEGKAKAKPQPKAGGKPAPRQEAKK